MESNPYFRVVPLDTDMNMVLFRGYGPDTVNTEAATVIKEVQGEVEVLFNGERHELSINRKSLRVPPNTPHTLHALGDAIITISLRPAQRPEM